MNVFIIIAIAVLPMTFVTSFNYGRKVCSYKATQLCSTDELCVVMNDVLNACLPKDCAIEAAKKCKKGDTCVVNENGSVECKELRKCRNEETDKCNDVGKKCIVRKFDGNGECVDIEEPSKGNKCVDTDDRTCRKTDDGGCECEINFCYDLDCATYSLCKTENGECVCDENKTSSDFDGTCIFKRNRTESNVCSKLSCWKARDCYVQEEKCLCLGGAKLLPKTELCSFE